MKGEFMLIINIEAFGPTADYQKAAQGVLNLVRGVPPAPGFDEVLAPGDFESRNRKKRLVDGIELPETIVGQLQEEAEKLSVSIGEEIVEADDRKRYGE
jgi:uncharacterized oxidoreductase